MFSEDQINSYKSTRPSAGLRERIRSTIETEDKKPFYLRVNFARYGAIAAALVVVLTATIILFGRGDAVITYDGVSISAPTKVTLSDGVMPLSTRSLSVEGVAFDLENRGKCTVRVDCGELYVSFGDESLTAKAGDTVTVKGEARLIWNPCTSEDTICRLTVTKGDDVTIYEVTFDSETDTYTVSPAGSVNKSR